MATTGVLPGLDQYNSDSSDEAAQLHPAISLPITMNTTTTVTRPTPYRVNCLIHAFRMRIGRLGGVTAKDLEQWLENQNWELDVAITHFKDITLPTARHADEINASGRTLIQQQKDNMLAGASYSRHGNHRRTISTVYSMIQASNGDRLSVLRIVNLLREKFFDYEEAIEMHENRRLDVAVLAEVDRDERRLCMRGPGAGEPTQVHKDIRVQIFLEAAGTDDWVSARNFLASPAIAWNLGRALDRWMQSGLPTIQPTRTEYNRARYSAPVLPHLEQDNLWAPPHQLFQVTAADATDVANSSEDYGNGSYVGECARYIDLELQNAVIGINRPDMLEQFSMTRGKGTIIPMLAAGIPEGENLVPMSFRNARHITVLNKTYLQNPSRSGGITKRQTGIQYTGGEIDWMYCWHEDRVMQYQAQNPGFVLAANQTWKDVVNFDVGELTEDLNAEFEGRVVNGSLATRPSREKSSVDQKRHKLPILCTDFGFEPRI